MHISCKSQCVCAKNSLFFFSSYYRILRGGNNSCHLITSCAKYFIHPTVALIFLLLTHTSHPYSPTKCQHMVNDTTDIYSDLVMRIVSEEDDTRAIWPSSPSAWGWATGVRSSDGCPNGNELTYATGEDEIGNNDTDNNMLRTRKGIEVHGPYLHGSSLDYPSVNGHADTSQR